MREAKQSAKNREEDQQDSIQSILDAYKWNGYPGVGSALLREWKYTTMK
jgi:hypothetical protein